MRNEIFVGRQKELDLLERLYASDRFEMLLLHGRRRVGKSFLLGHFASLHEGNTVFFTADRSDEKSNVQAFTFELKRCLKGNEYISSFEKWSDVYSFLDSLELKDRLVIIIDEFTYLLNSDPAFDSGLQNAIDRILRKKNIFLILCGSEVSVIEETVDDATKPLYGRKTADLRLLPFSYREARDFFPGYSDEDALTAYSVLGGIPLYLSLFDDSRSIKDNVIINCLSTTGYLYSEVDTLLRMELKETHFYRSILLAINAGASSFGTIRDKVGEEPSKVAKYLGVLINLGIIRKEVPCGEKERTRNTLYSIEDNYVAFYFAFIYRHRNKLNGLISPELFYERELTKEKLNAYIGHRFEGVCESYLRCLFYNGKLPFSANSLGRWWGNNPVLKRQEEIDILALDDDNALIAECKYTEEPFDVKQLNDLRDSALCINRKNRYFMIFSRSGITEGVREQIEGDDSYRVISMEALYHDR
ncbi:MAG: ATP-binding protein [Bullifex sp.]|nr:ATP-binding protein [Bullifex sp.]